MKRYSFLGCMAVAAVLAGCASVQDYDYYLQTWIGKSESDLVAMWGAPIQVTKLEDDRQLFVYMRQKSVLIPTQNAQNLNFGNYTIYDPMDVDSVSETLYACETTFTIQNQTVIDYAWAGDACGK